MVLRWRWHHSASVMFTAIAVICSAMVFAYLAGFTHWLDELPWATWLLFALFLFGVGLCLGAGVSHYGGYLALKSHIYQAAQTHDPNIDTMLARIYLMQIEAGQKRSDERWRELIQAIAALTESPLTGNTCKHCGHAISVTADPYAPSNHAPQCCVPYARKMIVEDLSSRYR